jgi:hypothetical protein
MTVMTAIHIHHIYLGTVKPGDEIHLHFGEPEPDGLPSKSYEAPESGGQPSKYHESPEAAMLERMKESTISGNMHGFAYADLIQKVHDGLISLGYQPVAPTARKPGHTPAQYLRWIVGREGSARAYMNTASLVFTRRDDRAKVAEMDGADPKSENITFSITTPEGAEQALAAARAVL